MTWLEKTGKTVEEAIQAALSELGVTADRVECEVLETPSKGFLGIIGCKPAKIRVLLKPLDAVDVAKEFLHNIFDQMNLVVSIEQSNSEDGLVFNLCGDDLGVLIGKHGQTLDALQYLTNLAANRDVESRLRIILDVEEYRKRRVETLTRLAQRLADKVRRTGDKVVLEPMNPQERKVIHMALQDDRRVITYSEGDEPYRKVVIALRR